MCTYLPYFPLARTTTPSPSRTTSSRRRRRASSPSHKIRHWLSGYFAQGVPSLFLASSFRMCLTCEVLKGMFPWRTRYPLS